MRIERWDPFRDWLDLRDEFDRFLDWALSSGISRRRRAGESTLWVPPIDVSETSDAVIVKADLPGVSEDDIQISITGNLLSIKGERKQEVKEENENFFRVERVYGAFERVIELPAEVEPDKAKATFKNGVLTIEIPKSEKVKPKEIKIEVVKDEDKKNKK